MPLRPEGAPVGFYTAELKAGFAARRIGVITYYDEVQSLLPEKVEQLAIFVKEQIDEGALDEGLLLTSLEVST